MKKEQENGPCLRVAVQRVRLQEILDYLKGHDWHIDQSGPQRIAWNIKVHNDDIEVSNPKIRSEYGIQARWDKRWEKTLEDDDFRWQLFGQCCEDGLSFVGDSTKFDFRRGECNWAKGILGLEKSSYEIRRSGKSGCWLELHQFEGVEIDQNNLLPYDIDDDKAWEDGDIDFKYYQRLKLFCESLDKFDADFEFNRQVAFRRSVMEEEWDERFKKAKNRPRQMALNVNKKKGG